MKVGTISRRSDLLAELEPLVRMIQMLELLPPLPWSQIRVGGEGPGSDWQRTTDHLPEGTHLHNGRP